MKFPFWSQLLVRKAVVRRTRVWERQAVEVEL